MGRARKLSDDVVKSAAEELKQGVASIDDLAKKHNVSYMTMYNSLVRLGLVDVKKRNKAN